MKNHTLSKLRFTQAHGFAIGLSLAALLFTSSLLADPIGDASKGFYKNESDFLAYASSDWRKVADGVYERTTETGGTERRGFGAESIDYFLESAQQQRQRVIKAGPDQDMARYLKAVTELDQKIASLKQSKARVLERTVSANNKNITCFGIGAGVSIGTSASCLPGGGGTSTANVFFSDFAPCHQAEGIALASGTLGTYQVESGPLGCWQGRSATAMCLDSSIGCAVNAFAEIDFVTCDEYQVSESTEYCLPGGGGGGPIP